MSLFIICRVSKPELMARAVARAFPRDHMSLQAGEWLVMAKGTPKSVCERLVATSDETIGVAMIFEVAGYHGLATMEIWDWINSRSAIAAE